MLTGEYRNTIDEKGRILIPSKLRAALQGDALIVTRGVEECLWLLLPEDFERLRQHIMDGPGAMFDKRLRLLQRFIAHLSLKSETVMLGVSTYLELWSVPEYEAYIKASEDAFAESAQSLSEELRLENRR